MTKIVRGAGGGSSTVSNTPDTMRSQDTIEFTLGLCEGPIAGLANGPKTFFLGDTPLVSQNDENNFDSFELHLYHGDANASEIRNTLGGIASNSTVGVNLAELTPVTRQTPSQLANQIDILEVRINFSQLFRTDSKGAQRPTTAEFKLEYKQTSDTEWMNFFSSSSNVTGVFTHRWETSYGDDHTQWSSSSVNVRQTGNLEDLDTTLAENFRITGGVSDTTKVGFNSRKTSAFGTLWLNTTTGAFEFVPDVVAQSTILGSQSVSFALTASRERGDYSSTWDLTFTLTNPDNVKVSGKTTSTYVKEFVRRVPRINGDWEIRLTKLSSDTDDNLYVNMTWESFQCITAENRSYDNLAVIRGLGIGTNQFSSIPTFSGVYHGKLIKVPSNYDPVTRFYNGIWDGTFKLSYSDNPAWCLYDLLTNETYGVKAYYPQLLVDRFSFYEGAQWCDELVPRPTGGYQPRYTYNDYIQADRQGLEQCYYIAGAFGAILSEDLNGSVVLKVDKPTPMVQIFGAESTTVEEFNYSKTDITTRANDIEVKFINPNLNWAEDVRRIYDQDLIDKYGRIPLSLITVGCLDVYEAQRRAQIRLISANTEVTTVTFATARQGCALQQYDIIGIADPYMNWGASGRIKSVSGNTISLRDRIYLNLNQNLTMDVQTPSGIHTLTVQNQSGSLYATSLNITSGVLPEDLPDRAQFTLSSTVDLGLVKPFRVLSISEEGTVEDQFTITAIEVNSNKYGDADNLVSTGMQDYSFSRSTRPDAPVNLKATSGTQQLFINPDGQVKSRIYLTWEQNLTSFTDDFIVHYRRLDRDSFTAVRVVGTDTYLENVQDGMIYEVYIEAVGATGERSQRSRYLQHQVVGKTALPSNVTAATATQTGSDVRIDITPITDLDLAYYLVRLDGEILGTTSTTRFTHQNVVGTVFNYEITAVDTLGQASPTPYQIVHAAPAPNQPGASSRFSGDQIVFSITPPSGQNVPIKEYLIESNGVEIYRGSAIRYQMKADWGGDRVFTIKSINTAGQDSPATTLTVTVNPPASVVLSGVITETGNFRLSWNQPAATLPIDHYVLKNITDNDVEDEDLRATTYSGAINWLGDRTYAVWAVDTAGNAAPATNYVVDIVEPSVSTVSAIVSKSTLQLVWTGQKGSLPIREYQVFDGSLPLARLDAQIYQMPVNWNGAKTFNVYAVDILGNMSTPGTHIENIDPPAQPTASIEIVGQNAKLSWNEPASELVIDSYQIYRAGLPIQKLLGTSTLLTADWLGTMEFGVSAIDAAGNEGAQAIVGLNISAPTPVIMSHSFEGQQLRLSWTTSTGSLPIQEYVLKRGTTEIARLSSNSYTLTPDWGGSETFSVTAVDTSGNISPTAATTVDIVVPTAPAVTSDVIDNNVLLRWSNGAKTLPVVATEIRKGASFPSAQVLHQSDATFAAFFEFQAGTYDYWLVNIDSAGNYGAEIKLAVEVTEPPDFVLQAQISSDFSGTKANVALQDGVLLFGIDTTQTYAEHFTTNGFTSPQDQINAGFPFYMQPIDPDTPSYYEEDIDYGTVISSSIISVTPTTVSLAGDGSLTTEVWYRTLPTDPWTQVVGQSRVYAQNFQYVKVRLVLTADTTDDLVRVSALNIRLNTKIRSDAGNGTASSVDADGTSVAFNVNFIDVQSISVTAKSTTPVTAIYDFLDVANPSEFSVYLFDRDGVRVSGDFSWTARGF